MLRIRKIFDIDEADETDLYRLRTSGRLMEWLGRPEGQAARTELARMLEQSKARWVSPYSVAIVYNGLDDREQALAWLERGLQQPGPGMVFLRSEPKWKNLHGEPRFEKILRLVGLPG